MNSKERVKKAFKHLEPDRVPISELQMTSDVASEILGRKAYTGGGSLHLASTKALFQSEEMGREFGERVMKDVSDLYTALDIDIVMLPWRMQEKPTREIDENTYYYEDENTGLWEIMKYVQKADMFSVIDSSIRKEGIPAIERLVEAREKAVKEQKDEEKEHVESPLKDMDYLVNRFGKEKFIVGTTGVGLPALEATWLEALILRPDLIERYAYIGFEDKLKSIELQAKHGVDAILCPADLADKNGPLYSPQLFRKFYLPELKKIVNFCHKLGLFFIYHTDGNTWPIAQELFVESGVDGYYAIDESAGMDISELKDRLPHLTLWGHIDGYELLLNKTKDEIAAKVIDSLKKGAPGGGYIFDTSTGISGKTPVENFLIMLETAKKYGKYPISL